jgi:hypothetical protein
VVGPPIILGYGALIGSTAGAIRGLRLRENLLADLVKDALKAGQATPTPQQVYL